MAAPEAKRSFLAGWFGPWKPLFIKPSSSIPWRFGNVLDVTGGEIALAGIGVLTAHASIWVLPRMLKTLRAMKDDASAKAWRALPRARKKKISRSLRRGLAVEDPHDVDLALGLIARIERIRKVMRPINFIYYPVMLGFLIVGLLSNEFSFMRWFAAAALVALGFAELLTAHQRRQMRRSSELTRQRMAGA